MKKLLDSGSKKLPKEVNSGYFIARINDLNEIISDFREVLELYAGKEHKYINRFATNILAKHAKRMK